MFAAIGGSNGRLYVLLRSAYPNAKRLVASAEISMTVFYTKAARLLEPVLIDGKPLLVDGQPYTLPEVAREQFELSYIPDGMPFLLDVNGHYNRHINQFLLWSSSRGCTSRETWRNYAYDLRQFEHFLLTETQCAGIMQAGADEIDLYFRKRRTYERYSDLDTKPVKSVTWKRQLAAFSKFSEWRAEVTVTPDLFAARKRGIQRKFQKHIVKSGAPSSKLRGTIKSISMSDYIVFRDEGLGRLGGSGSQTSTRNVAFAELAITTGMRLGENCSLLMSELPDVEQKDAFLKLQLPMRLAEKTTKGQKARGILVPRRVLRDYLRPYIEIERDASIDRATGRGIYSSLRTILRVRNEGSEACQISTPRGWQKADYDSLSAPRRRLMFAEDRQYYPLVPSLLWLQQSGLPANNSCFSAVFPRACALLKREHGKEISVSPHTLRHTFAIYKLTQLIEATCETIENLRRERRSTSPQAFGQLIADPLTELQRLLGHATQETTRAYLTYVEQASDIIDGEIQTWIATNSQ